MQQQLQHTVWHTKTSLRNEVYREVKIVIPRQRGISTNKPKPNNYTVCHPELVTELCRSIEVKDLNNQ